MITPDRVGNLKATTGLVSAGAILGFLVWGQGEIERKVFTPGDAAQSVEQQYGVTGAHVVDTNILLPSLLGCSIDDSVRYMLKATTPDGTISEFRVCKSILPREPSTHQE